MARIAYHKQAGRLAVTLRAISLDTVDLSVLFPVFKHW
ncbi:hypothetical protein BSPLISOX_472 [uncultured Gammaproteobacteria bacterium]|nr:hypothetical protein [uncultured Gammaproteobacteria bacterium]CAC9458093.1 hypothetical protein [uncultured Gammaproteobacteria bacterium]VVH64892.1 hypothetical protein BSPLISOX_472 [uncultured Gammaproteobacteria bacterium]